MSLFIGNTSQYSQANVDPEKIKLAEVQYNAMSATFNKVLRTCENKCIGHEYGEGDLNTAEQCCIDRCVSKYVQANYLIGNHVQDHGFNPYRSMPEYKKVQSILEKKSLEQ